MIAGTGLQLIVIRPASRQSVTVPIERAGKEPRSLSGRRRTFQAQPKHSRVAGQPPRESNPYLQTCYFSAARDSRASRRLKAEKDMARTVAQSHSGPDVGPVSRPGWV
jgi:hypothetical protein